MASISVPCPKSALLARLRSNASIPADPVSFPSRASNLLGFQWTNKKRSSVVKLQVQLNEIVAKTSSNCVPVPDNTFKVAPLEENTTSVANKVPDESTISSFMEHVSDLVKLVDSRDICELQLKQLDCEVIIRKKEALQPPQAPVFAVQPPAYQHAVLPSPPAAAPSSAPAAPPALPSPAKPALSSHLPLKCPMAGTFYTAPAPGEPPFVKVGDKVQKGQVICIVEAMKLMNEIEADQSGTIAEILVENGKPVSLDMPLFIIVP